MKFRDTVYGTILLFLCNIGKTVELLTHGNPVNVTDTIHGFPGHNIDLADVMELLLNQTAEIENLKQQSTNDRSTIQSLQNRVFFLEAELNKLNVSKLPSIQEFSTYLSSMNQLTQNMATNEANDRNLTKRLDVAVKSLDDLKVQVRYTSLSLLDIRQSMTEELNGSLIQLIEERVSEHFVNISMKVGFSASSNAYDINWSGGALVFDVVITNMGNGYNPSDGVFTAPLAGVYVFFVNVQGYYTQNVYADIVQNGSTKVRTMAVSDSEDRFDAGTNLAVLTLQKKDRVWVKYYAGKGYYNHGPITTFSGFLI